MSDIPVWDHESIYRGFEDPRYLTDLKSFSQSSQKILKILKVFPKKKREQVEAIARLTAIFDRAQALAEQLSSFAYMLFSVDTRNEEASKQLNLIDELSLPLQDAVVQFRLKWSEANIGLAELLKAEPQLKAYRLSLEEDRYLAKRQMSPKEENLAADLGRSGGDAWGRLQASVSSTLSVVWDEKKKTRKTVTELRQMAYSPDRKVRQKAFGLEVEAWKSVEIPLAASLNGVKGHATTLNRRRGWKDPLDLSMKQARISKPALEALIATMEESLPLFRRYLRAKAQALHIDRCEFSDLFAPVGKDETRFTWDQARNFIVEKFAGFSRSMSDFASLAFEKKWIHARPLEGKVGGAYCTSLPISHEPRILANFDGSFGEMKTLAHELGHGWHFWLLKDHDHVYHEYPMTLAETASIFAETIIFEEALKSASDQTALFLIEQNLQDSTQVIVDILSRYHFEKAVFEKRSNNELSPPEFCELMLQAQRDTYGEGLDQNALHPYMWAVKGHYYQPGLAFYNYPYAFGQLFSLALYNRFKAEGSTFQNAYEELLKGAGTHTADDLASRSGFDLKDQNFWRQGIREIEKQIVDFERRSHGQ